MYTFTEGSENFSKPPFWLNWELLSIKKDNFSNSELFNILNDAYIGMCISNLDGEFEYVNIALLDMLGYTEAEIYQASIVITHKDDIILNEKIRSSLLTNPSKPIMMDKRYVHKDGHTIYGFACVRALQKDNGKPARLVSQIIDIGYRKEVEESADLFRTMMNASRDAMFIIHPDTGKILDVNAEASKSLEYTYEEVTSLEIKNISHSMNDESMQATLKEIKENKHLLLLGENVTKTGRVFPVELRIDYLDKGESGYILAVVRDITERKKSEALIWQQANYDMLTGLSNRNMLHDRLEQAVKKAQREKVKIAVLSLDLDKFKEVNDSFGHDIGDQLLKQVGERILACIREIDTVSRLGGDEFCVVIENVDKAVDVNRIASSILESIRKAFFLGDHKVFISTSIGIAFYPDDACDVDGLLKSSDQAMYFAKNRGRNCFQFYTDKMQEQALYKMHLSRDLHQSIEKGQLFIEYQPIVNLQNGLVYKAEALLRWNHPEHGLVDTNEFIALAEENGAMTAIGEWVFSEVLGALKILRSEFSCEFQVSINASPLQLRDSQNYIDQWHHKLIDAGLSADAILIEITESLMVDVDQVVIDKLLLFRDYGIPVALDDFGTGYFSLVSLQKLDIDYLKIDKSFTNDLLPGSSGEVLCKTMMLMAHGLGLKVVAEGVETQEQYNFLKSVNCDYAQGYFFSKPLLVNNLKKNTLIDFN